MKPYQTIILVIALIAAAVFLHLRSKQIDPRVQKLADCYVELAWLHEGGDTTSSLYVVRRDSVLSRLGLSEQSINAIKADLERAPDKMMDVWELVEKKLKERKEATDLIKP